MQGVDINIDRLVADLKELSKFGYDKKTGGIFRPAYSLAYKESVNWLISKMQDCGPVSYTHLTLPTILLV